MLFDFDKSTIKTGGGADSWIVWLRFMNENTNSKVNLSGFTDDVGTEAYNLKLSDRRLDSQFTGLSGDQGCGRQPSFGSGIWRDQTDR